LTALGSPPSYNRIWKEKGNKIKNPWGNFSLKGFYRSTGIRASGFCSGGDCCVSLKFLFPLVVKKPLGKIFSQGVFTIPLPLRNVTRHATF